MRVAEKHSKAPQALVVTINGDYGGLADKSYAERVALSV